MQKSALVEMVGCWTLVAGIWSGQGCSTTTHSGGSSHPSSQVQTSRDPSDPHLARILAAHNRVRAEHCAPPLAWSDELARVAQDWANALSSRGCAFEHNQTPFGENLWAGTTDRFTADDVVQTWLDERQQYDFARGGFSMQTGHFTQLVWQRTGAVGCGLSSCNGNDIWVCNYDPPGNVEGLYEENVLPQACSR